MSRERSVRFTATEVRATLEGRKTQFRRIAKPPRGAPYDAATYWEINPVAREDAGLCPYGTVGDTLYVRETWKYLPGAYEGKDGQLSAIEYLADGKQVFKGRNGAARPSARPLDHVDGKGFRPSVHMPRWASRLSLEVTDIRVERLNDISEEDARAEGITDGGCLTCGEREPCGCADPHPDPRDSFIHLWESINGENTWDLNPWVWVVSFRPLSRGGQQP